MFLSSSELLFRQLVLRRTLLLSSSQLLNPLLSSQFFLPLSHSVLLFTDLFPEGALTNEDGGFSVATYFIIPPIYQWLKHSRGGTLPLSPALSFVCLLFLRRKREELELARSS